MSWREWSSDFFNTRLGRIIVGIIKLVLAGFLINLVTTIADRASDVQIGGTTIPVGTILTLIVAFFPIMLLISAMRDLGIGL
ncbi:MAG: hypothetical protein QW607_04400 [Desulfurococcaceae archaeon]